MKLILGIVNTTDDVVEINISDTKGGSFIFFEEGYIIRGNQYGKCLR